MNRITSSQNTVVKEVKSLKNKKNRDEKGLFFIEGVKFVEEALREKVEIARLFVSEQFFESDKGKFLLSQLKATGETSLCCSCFTEIFLLTDRLFKEISDTENPQGVLAVIKMQSYTMDQISGGDNLFVILESIQDPGNMGTIIRTADAAGYTGVIVTGESVDVYNPKVLRSTMGSVFRIPLIFNSSIISTLDMLKSKGIKVYAAHLKGTSVYFEPDIKDNCAIIIGNESKGVSDQAASFADLLVKIPMPGKAESLNASVAAGLLMYESVRQRLNHR